MKVSTILDQIGDGAIALPVFQRGYVWNRDQVRGLLESPYRRHPVGSLLTWVTRTESVDSRGDSPLQPGYVKLLLDGQQRITTLYGIIRGKEPPFFEGNLATFTGLHFNMETERFQFYAPILMSQEPRWISVTELMEWPAPGNRSRIDVRILDKTGVRNAKEERLGRGNHQQAQGDGGDHRLG